MSYGICPLSLVPIRSSSSEKSEMMSQLLFGELVEILDHKGLQWLRIRCHYDNFVGWVNANQIKAITPSEFERFHENFSFNLEITQPVMAEDHAFPITLGAQLPNFDGLGFKIGDTAYTFSGQAIIPSNLQIDAAFVLKIAKKYLYTPYLWGGRSPFGIDSAGFVQAVFKIAGFRMPREAVQQVYFGETVDFIEEALPGDIAFFENRNGKVTHAGIIMPENYIIHAHGHVRIDKIDHYGIYSLERNRYTHKLRLIKRILEQKDASTIATDNTTNTKSKQVELF